MSLDKFRRVLATGEILFRQNEAGHEAYLIDSGSIRIYTEQDDGERAVATLGPGEIFGEMALVSLATRSASAMAAEPSVIVIINQQFLQSRLVQADPMLRHLLRITVGRCRDLLKPGENDIPQDFWMSGNAASDHEQALQRLRIEQELELALDRNEFVLYFQPIVRLSDGGVVGFEALIRWIKPDGTRVPPNEFIWIAEESGLIVRMGHWIIRTACAELRRLQTLNDHVSLDAAPLFMAANLSIRQFDDPDLFRVIEESLATEKLAPGQLRLEITESLVMSNLESAKHLLRRCKALGAKLAIDDFGTGYSALSYLHLLPVDTLKLDASFTREMTGNDSSRKIVRAVAALATDLGMEAVAEGIETEQQAAMLRTIGILYAQGYLFARPMPIAECLAYLQGPSNPPAISP